MKMIVTIDGQEIEREVDCVERGRHGIMIHHPVLNEGEEAVFTVDGSVIIVKVFDPAPDSEDDDDRDYWSKP